MTPLLTFLFACALEDGPDGDSGEVTDTTDTGDPAGRALDLALAVEGDALLAGLADLEDLPAGADGARDAAATRAWAGEQLADAGFAVAEWAFATDGSWNDPCAEDPTCAGVDLLATWPGAPDGPCVLVGAHLDARGGAGINDNGTGMVAAVELARATAAGGLADAAPVCFAIWDREEAGEIGSWAWVSGLEVLDTKDPPPGPAADGVLAYLNLDMLGSVNGVPGLQELDGPPGTDGWAPPGSEVLNEAVEAWFARDGREPDYLPRSGHTGSDHVPFIAAEVPVVWLFSGAGDVKSVEEAAAYGGTAGAPMDPCYHEGCDTLDNVDPSLLLDLARATAWTVGTIAGRAGLAE